MLRDTRLWKLLTFVCKAEKNYQHNRDKTANNAPWKHPHTNQNCQLPALKSENVFCHISSGRSIKPIVCAAVKIICLFFFVCSITKIFQKKIENIICRHERLRKSFVCLQPCIKGVARAFGVDTEARRVRNAGSRRSHVAEARAKL